MSRPDPWQTTQFNLREVKMPNHVTTRCAVDGPRADVEAFRTKCIRTTWDRPVGDLVSGPAPEPKRKVNLDFNAVIPMPECASAVDDDSLAPNILIVLTEATGMMTAWDRLAKYRPGLGPWRGLANYERGEVRALLEREMPEAVANARAMARCVAETGHKSWYGWAVENWGTKWNAYDYVDEGSTLDGDRLSVRFKFETAWEFPLPVFKALARQHPTLRFWCATFDEGWNFAGEGYFNDDPQFHLGDATDDLHVKVYGYPPEREDDEQSVQVEADPAAPLGPAAVPVLRPADDA